MPRRSIRLVKETFIYERRRPLLWLVLVTVLLQILSDESATLFGADQDNLFDLTGLGFSPERPFRLGGLPWLLSGLVHSGWGHLALNWLFLLLIYFSSRKALYPGQWWVVLPTLQVLVNLSLFIGAKLVAAPKAPSLFLGLSGVSLALLGLVSVTQSKLLRGVVFVLAVYELSQWPATEGLGIAPYSHLISLATGLAFGLIVKNRFSSLNA